MLIVNKKSFYTGMGLLGTFLAVFYFLLTPFINDDGVKLSGLEYSDKVFNQLSKGSSNFIHLAAQAADSMLETEISPELRLPKGEFSTLQTHFLENSKAKEISWEDNRLFFHVNLGLLLEQATEDAQLLYFNRGEQLEAKYHQVAPLTIAKAWWNLLTRLANNLKRENKIPESNAIDTVITRAVEPGNNYYGIPYLNIAQNIPLITGFLLFYVIYTIWYGFAVYEIFNGLGLISSAEDMEEREEMSC